MTQTLPAVSEMPLWRLVRPGPRVGDPAAAATRLAELIEGLGDADRALLRRPRVRRLLLAVADHSPYLWQLARADLPRLLSLLESPPERALARILAGLSFPAVPAANEADVMRALRRAKQETALLIALADLGGAWPLDAVLLALSQAADAFIAAALGFLLRAAAAAGKILPPHPDDPARGCGLTILGLGKLGGRELNYSSDVDLIAIFDPATAPLANRDEAAPFFVRIVKDLVRLLQTRTADGYVLRVDLRLRPDPSSTAVAIRLAAAFYYYEAYGQNWERAAMIKARPVAGDMALGATFIQGLAPFVWRKYFDYAAIADIHAMKRQIHAVKGHAEIAVAGHNVKLGRGGIREIEFFVQTQQLIFGGKRPALRGSQTLPMLRRLQRERWVTRKALGDLTRAYRFLREVEHRLQMVADEQTHKLPREAADLARFARFMGFASMERFAAAMTRHLSRVVTHYALLFENAPGLDDFGGSLVFTGVSDDPETIETLSRLGFKDPEAVTRTVRDWHFGRRGAVRSARARETLTNLVPGLLQTFAHTADPDAALMALDKALERMPAAAELFAILTANAALRRLFGDMLGSAPRLAREITTLPHLLDAAIHPATPAALDDDTAARGALAVVATEAPVEVFLDALRDYVHEEHFLIGLRLLSGLLDADDAGAAYSALAVGAVRAALAQARAAFAAEHGDLPGSAMVVVAMGKLGSREMTAASDLDIVVLYDFDPSRAHSRGPRPLHATQYFSRLTQRLVSSLTAATRRGRLYEVDMRLRPSGRQGPLATQFSAFVPYQHEGAETWEHMALTRARVVAGDDELGARVTHAITAVLRAPPKPGLRRDVADMRALVAASKPARDDWDLKLVAGGLLDVEFIAQYVVLAKAHGLPQLLHPATRTILEEAGRCGALDPTMAEDLAAAHRLMTNAMQIMRLALDDGVDPASAGQGVRARLAAAGGVPDFARLVEDLAAARQAVREIFADILSGDRADALG